MKKLSFLIPTYNEEENVAALHEEISIFMQQNLSAYDYEILFIDNKSRDNTRKKIRLICQKDARVRAIFNIKNFGQFNSPYYGLCQTTGDCAILMCADFQDPLNIIPCFVKEWENGAKVVCGIKTSSKENGIMYHLRSCYYRTIKKMSDIDQIEHFTGFGLYDRSFLEILKTLNDPTPFLRGIVAEYAPDRIEIPYQQAKRRAGKTHNNWYSLYDAAMLSFTSYTKVGLRIATIAGFLMGALSFLVGFVYLIMKFVWWDRFVAGTAPLVLGVFFMGSVQLFFIGLLGEYILNINTRVVNRPLVLEECRVGFEQESKHEDDP